MEKKKVCNFILLLAGFFVVKFFIFAYNELSKNMAIRHSILDRFGGLIAGRF